MDRYLALDAVHALTSVVFTDGKHEGKSFGWVSANDSTYSTFLAGRSKLKGIYRVYVAYSYLKAAISL